MSLTIQNLYGSSQKIIQGQLYDFKLQLINYIGLGKESNIVTVKAQSRITIPTELKLNLDDTVNKVLTVSWKAPLTVETTLTGYTVFV